MDFGDAIRALKQGKKVTRRGWNGRGMFLYLKPATMVKAEWCHDPELKALCEANGGELLALGTICMYTHDSTGRNAILTGWLASQSDMLLDDWELSSDPVTVKPTLEPMIDDKTAEQILDDGSRYDAIMTLQAELEEQGLHADYDTVRDQAMEIANKMYHKAMEKI